MRPLTSETVVARPPKRPRGSSAPPADPLPSALPVPTSAASGTAIDKATFLRKFVEGALRQLREGNPEEYHKLVRVFAFSRQSSADAQQYADTVAPWIPALSASVSSLGLAYRELVGTVFGSDWVWSDNDRFAHRYATLVLQIVSAHPEWVPQAMAALVRWFSFGARPSDAAAAPMIHGRVHALLQEIYRAIPTCGGSLAAALTEAWPFRTAKTNTQVLFVRNALRCLEYAPGVHREVLRMTLSHMIQIDVEVQVELEDLESDDEDDEDGAGQEAEDAGEEGVFQFDEDAKDSADREADSNGSDSDSDSDSGSDSEDSVVGGSGSGSGGGVRDRRTARKTVERLDAQLSALLTWLEPQFQADAQTGEMPEAASRLYLVLLDLFGAVVLPTFKSRYTQFVLFYLSARDPQYSDVFLGTMVSKIGEPVRGAAQSNVPDVARVAAAAYLSSFVARARFLDAPVVRSVVGVLVQWANAYLDWQDHHQQEQRRGQGDTERHIVFHAVTQAVLYMFCFRWRDLATAHDGGPVTESELDSLRWCSELDGLQRVVFSRLNPLRTCAPAVAQQFASVASQTNLMFCYAILQQNRRAHHDGGSDKRSPASGAGAEQVLRERLDSFFPFDPMALPVSRQFIDPIYLEWQEVGDEPSDDESDAGLAADSGTGLDIGEGQEEADVVGQILAMSISPRPPVSVGGQAFDHQL